MQIIKSGLIGVDQGTETLFSHFDSNGPMWSESGPRETRKRIAFKHEFALSPNVITYPCMWDMDTKANLRLDIFAEDINEFGFDLVFRTWSDSRIARVRAVWQAIGAMPDDDVWDERRL